MPNQKIIIPLPYKEFTTFEGPAWYLDNCIYVDIITADDFSSFFRDEPEEFYQASINVNTVCIYISPVEIAEDKFDEFIRKTAIQLRFVLNTFSMDTPVTMPFAALLEMNSKARIIKICDIEPITNLHNLKQLRYKFRGDIKPATVSEFFRVVKESCSKNSQLHFSLDRYNSALAGNNILNKVVDITISLEALIEGNVDLKFKFALYNSFLAESSPEDRITVFDLLNKLYDTRSGIVHGDTNAANKNIKIVQENWNEILRIARASLIYYLFFLINSDRNEWKNHLRDLVFGKTPRLVE